MSTEELETVFKFLKRNKAAGIETINSNIVLDTYDEIEDIFLILNTSLQQSTIPDNLKKQRVTPLFKSGGAKNVIKIQKFLKESWTIEFTST